MICFLLQGLNTTFDIEAANEPDKDLDTKEEEQIERNESVSIVTVVIEDKEKVEESEKGDKEEKIGEKRQEKQKTPKKKKFNVVKDFKKPNTTNVVSKLSEYLKTPVPMKSKEDKNNTEEAKNKRNSLKDAENAEKEKDTPKKIIKRTPPKSKWDAIMSKIEGSKEGDKEKPKAEIKSKIEAFQHIPPPAPPKKKEPKPKKKISNALPDFSKVQSKLKYTAAPAPPKPKKEDSPEHSGTNKKLDTSKTDSSKSVTDSPKRKLNVSKSKSPNGRAKGDLTKRQESVKDSSPSRRKDASERGRERRLSKIKNERVRSLSGDSSVKRPDVKDRAVHIDLADSLDGRGSRAETGSLMSSCQSSRTDMSTTEEDVYHTGSLKRKFAICFVSFFLYLKNVNLILLYFILQPLKYLL